jgi:DNA repair photolyase
LAVEADREYWEPGAATLESRRAAIREAHTRGIRTWVSVEPVLDVNQAIRVISDMAAAVDFWKVGKLNHDKQREAAIDWRVFLATVTALLNRVAPGRYYIKKDLAAYGCPKMFWG